MVDLGDALGVLLIGSLFVVVFWRVFEAWLKAKIRKRVDEANRDHENDVPHDACLPGARNLATVFRPLIAHIAEPEAYASGHASFLA